MNILELLILGPIERLFEILFNTAYGFLGHAGLSIVFLSLAVNFLVLPLYNRADLMQDEARKKEKKLAKGIAHIKRTFNGDEKMMMLSTYYRQNDYSPLHALKGSMSLLLEIPFFLSAYRFLSSLTLLHGASLGPIADLSLPDGLLFGLNLLPFLMTAINLVTGAIYMQGYPFRMKLRVYGMALLFLVLLYNSPSGLVFYWTLNNVFSLIKTIRQKKFLLALSGVCSVVLPVGIFWVYGFSSPVKVFTALLLFVLFAMPLLKNKRKISLPTVKGSPNRRLFFLSSLFMAVLVGALIPSTFIGASPQEFIALTLSNRPEEYLWASLAVAVGTFLLWMPVFYTLATDKGKVLFERLTAIACPLMLINYLFFATGLGVLSPSLQYESGMVFGAFEILGNILVMLLAGVMLYILLKKNPALFFFVLLSATLALGALSIRNTVLIRGASVLHTDRDREDQPYFTLSREGKNVMVIMLDRALNGYFPAILKEDPTLKETYSGFTYYPNTISFGGYTNFGAPPLLGGYEYTPVAMNLRDTEDLVDKHNEALKVLPVAFLQEDFQVTVSDPTYANYDWIPDLSIFDGYPEIRTQITKGKLNSEKDDADTLLQNKRNFFLFSLMKTLPVAIQPALYNEGNYHEPSADYYTDQLMLSSSESVHVSSNFLAAYNVLKNLEDMTTITEGTKNTYLYLSNDTTHDPILLQEPTYTPEKEVDNREYDRTHADRFSTLIMDEPIRMAHFHANMASIRLLGDFFNFLKKEGVYDNTRIIIVADHGRDLKSIPNLPEEAELYYPLLLVKDFDAKIFSEDSTFMTNADVPSIALKGLVEKPTNPFTGKPITQDAKYAGKQYILRSPIWDTNVNNGKTFLPGSWASVKDDMRDPKNWTFDDTLRTLPKR